MSGEQLVRDVCQSRRLDCAVRFTILGKKIKKQKGNCTLKQKKHRDSFNYHLFYVNNYLPAFFFYTHASGGA